MIRRIGLLAVIGLALAFILIQFVPYGRDHTNPAVAAEPPWDSPRTRELAERACFDCHSNETVWPWYSNVAPISWLIQRDVEVGRDELNYSEWGRGEDDEAEESAESVIEGEMPPWYYEVIQSKARLNDSERDELIRGLIATFGSGEGDDEDDDHEDDDDDEDDDD
jgi:mono/diheme cytochrome c family protein